MDSTAIDSWHKGGSSRLPDAESEAPGSHSQQAIVKSSFASDCVAF